MVEFITDNTKPTNKSKRVQLSEPPAVTDSLDFELANTAQKDNRFRGDSREIPLKKTADSKRLKTD